MSFPSFSDLSEEQLDVYGFDNNIPLLIKGGPGSGKTVMALWRSNNLIQNSKKVSLLMYNNTLLEFTSPYMQNIIEESESDTNLLQITTVDKFLINKYRSVTGRNLRLGDYKTLLDWSLQQSRENLKEFFGSYFVVDEGQDFPNEFYSTLAQAWAVCRPDFCPTITADENQQIVEGRNSSLKEIKEKLGWVASALGEFGEKELTYNYRNTREIARFANFFYDNLETTPPNLPKKSSGVIPRYYNFNNIREQAIRIVRYKKEHPKKTIGVLVAPLKSSFLRKQITEAIRDVIDSFSDKDIQMECLQQYASRPEDLAAGVSKNLDFSSEGKITVLTRQSSKGLEFDTVFLTGLESVKVGSDINLTKRNLYVLSTRARNELFLFSNNNINTLPQVMTEDFFKEIISSDAVNMGNNHHPLSLTAKSKNSSVNKDGFDSSELLTEQVDDVDPDNPKFIFKKAEGNGVEDLWKLIHSLIEEESIIDVVLIGLKTQSYIKKMESKINTHSQNFISGLRRGNNFESRDGKTVRVLDAENISLNVKVPMIIANLEDVSKDESTQKLLKKVIDCTTYKSFFLLCKGVAEEQSEGLKMLKYTGDLKIIENSNDA